MRSDEHPGHLETRAIIEIADKFARTYQALEALVEEKGEVRIDRPTTAWTITWKEEDGAHVVSAPSLAGALQIVQSVLRGDPMQPEKMTVGGAKLGKCVTCGHRAQLTATGFCDDCCPSGDCPAPAVATAGPEPRPAQKTWWQRLWGHS